MRKLIQLIILICLVILHFKYFAATNKSIFCLTLSYCDSELKDKADLLMKATAENIIYKAHPTTTYKSYMLKNISQDSSNFIVSYEITYTSIIEGTLYMSVEVAFDKKNLDFVEIRRKADSSKFPIIEPDFSAIKDLIKTFRY